ncbi:peptidoglycan DD-metalloendopeptidase family protein [Nitratireductor sp. CAU 1489]|uniref:Peptidoglycan DD-metalloendopeptidase family protein n=1 Tax=Nitratireductor arenosus TaxID=2682096 RepID=A0A844QDI0_9HYPH|nr:M23 family metallopeptidase [Nitratireductor arenosus]MVA96061.1 peptidoglycan DD-metalloendopeptidase family protein [Nitratireductor arenosus]
MHNVEQTITALGNEPPLLAGGRSGPPDRREISARWLSGTFLTGLTSTVLMGAALLAALDGREQLATPPEIVAVNDMASAKEDGEAAKAGRVLVPRASNRARDRRRMEVSTVNRVGDRDLIRTMPFVHVKMALAAAYNTARDYPSFDPLSVFAEDGPVETATTGLIYGAKVESEVSLKTVDFPIETASFDEKSGLSAEEVETVVRNTGAILTDGDIQVAALHYVDPQRFGESLATATLSASYGVRIVQENVSVALQDAQVDAPVFNEEIVAVRQERPVAEIFADAGYGDDSGTAMADAISRILNAPNLKAGAVLRLGIESTPQTSRIMRASVYESATHILTIAVDDSDQFVPADAPEDNPEVAAAFDENRPVVRVRGDLPRVYDGIYRAAYSYGMSREMTQRLVKLLAADVDFQSRVSPKDRLEVFFSQPDEDNTASEDSELLYVKATFGDTTRTFYRFSMSDGTVDYFDAEGRSARQFLLRNPVPNGRFRSGFGGRRHPILGYRKMHTGVDWAAPRGTPIIAAGNGKVEKAGWAGGYGRQTIIRHANGYKTSYSHQNAIAKGVRAGARIRQGQVIGYVGSTGLSTGPHLHYELIVNGTKVDPMRVRLPTGRVLKKEELAAFNRERERIDALLADETGDALKLASR